MLVLSRKPGEQVRIAKNIIFTVLEVKGHSVRLGIEAPIHVPILRGEIRDIRLTQDGHRQEMSHAVECS